MVLIAEMALRAVPTTSTARQAAALGKSIRAGVFAVFTLPGDPAGGGPASSSFLQALILFYTVSAVWICSGTCALGVLTFWL